MVGCRIDFIFDLFHPIDHMGRFILPTGHEADFPTGHPVLIADDRAELGHSKPHSLLVDRGHHTPGGVGLTTRK